MNLTPKKLTAWKRERNEYGHHYLQYYILPVIIDRLQNNGKMTKLGMINSTQVGVGGWSEKRQLLILVLQKARGIFSKMLFCASLMLS